jgi:hypothetical protein
MNDFKLLIDTNVLIGLEDAQPVQASLAELVRLSSEHAVGLFVDGANYDDVARDKNSARREVTLSKLAKFQKLRGVPVPDNAKLVARLGESIAKTTGPMCGSWWHLTQKRSISW